MRVRILWGSMVMSPAMLLVVLQLVPTERRNPLDLSVTLLVAGIAFGACVVSMVLPQRLRRVQIRSASYQVCEQPLANSDGDYRSAPAVLRLFEDQAGIERSAWAGYQATMVVGMAIAEIPALLGFALAFKGAPMALALPLFALAWLAMATQFPTHARFVGPLEAFSGARWQS